MKIGVIAPWELPVPPGRYGGTENVVDGLCRGLVAQGHDVLLVASMGSRCPVPKELLNVGSDHSATTEASYAIRAYATLLDVDIIHDHTRAGFLIVGDTGDPPIITTNHNLFDAERQLIYQEAARRRVGVVAISDHHASTATGVRLAGVVHNGVDVDNIPIGKGDGQYACVLSRMSPTKGIRDAILLARKAGMPLKIAAKTQSAAERQYFREQVYPLLNGDAEFLGEVSAREKYELLGGAVALLNPIRWDEPFGMAMIESLACFPADTPVTAAGVVRGMERLYTGEMVRIETERGDIINATADHPFWTQQGWTMAGALSLHSHRLLYSGGYAEALPVHAGRIGDVVSSLRNDALAGRRGADGQELRLGGVAEAQNGVAQAFLAQGGAPPRHAQPFTVGLHRGHDRWGRNSLDPAAQSPEEVQATLSHPQHVHGAHGLAYRDDRGSLRLLATPELPRRSTEVLLLHAPGPGSPSDVRSTAAIAGHQAATDGPRGGVDQTPPRAEPHVRVDASPAGVDQPGSRPQYEAIRSLTRYRVRDFPVYNLTTLSGTYLAAGYLVHNCGTPVLATLMGAAPEIVDHGVTGYLRNDWTTLAADLERVGSIDREACRKAAVQRFGIDRMAREYVELYRAALGEERAA